MEPQHFSTDFRSPVYIDCIKTFYACTGLIASIKECRQINDEAAIAYISEHFATDIKRAHRKDVSGRRRREAAHCENVLFLFHQPLLIDIEDNGTACVLYVPETEALAATIAAAFEGFRKRKKAEQPTYSLIVSGRHGFYLKPVDIPKRMSAFEDHYNDDLIALHPGIVACLKRKNESGLHLFHGQPGTGKSSYLRNLISTVRKKEFIFLSPRLAASLDTPELINILTDNPGAILIIEDAEELLVSRDERGNNAISLLLNLTDGLLGESLHIQVICTFNTHISTLDKALLRKGRLRTLYEFKPLAADKTARLLRRLQPDADETLSALSLAEIYNRDAPDYVAPAGRKRIGFGANAA